MEKYYTPTIGEFREGFEYEYNWNNKGWVKTIFHIGSGDIDGQAGEWHEFSPNNPSTICRCKFLDVEDMQSLKWDAQVAPNGVTVGSIEMTGKGYTICFGKDRFCLIEWMVENYEKVTLFRGTIRNKAELEQIMNMLGIKLN